MASSRSETLSSVKVGAADDDEEELLLGTADGIRAAPLGTPC